jgi:hypothetical protein
MLTTLVIMALAQSTATGAEQGVAPAKEPDLPEIMVVGTVPRCHPLPGDPLDSVDLAPAAADSRQQVIKLDPVTGAMGVMPDDDPVTGPGIWQRAGRRIDQYVFRVPQDGAPLCIGAREKRASGWGQLRQVVDATPYHGKTVRVTMWAASRKATRVWFWVASGREAEKDKDGVARSSDRADMAAESGSYEFSGTHRWTPVSLTMGPVQCDQKKISFGVLLAGSGDLWIYQPEFQVIAEESPSAAKRDCLEVKGRRPSS